MSSANQQNNRFLRNFISFGLLGAMAMGFTWACVSSSSDNKGVGGNASNVGGNAGIGGDTSAGGNTGAGGHTTAGGAAGTGGVTSTLAGCNLDAGVVTGNACTPNPLLIAINNNAASAACPTGVWASDGTATAYFYAPWCTGTGGAASCTLTMTCTGGSLHIAGEYSGSGNGTGGLGMNLNVPTADAGGDCTAINASSQKGLTLDVNVTTLPSNTMYIGMSLKDGNSADYTAQNLTAGAQTIQIPWGRFSNKKNCGSIPGPGIASFYFAFFWYSDGAAHPVDITISQFGFY